MGRKISLVYVFLGLLSGCLGKPPNDLQSSTSTSVSVSTVTRKVTSTSASRPEILPNGTVPVTEQIVSAKFQNLSAHILEEEDGIAKPQKVKKKILASNLKNISDKGILVGEKQEKPILFKSLANGTEISQSKNGGKESSSDGTDLSKNVFIGNGTAVIRNKTLSENLQQTEVGKTVIEGRSLEDRSSEENVNVNPKRKIKTSTTEQTTTSSAYESFSEIQKVLNNNFLSSNEGQNTFIQKKVIPSSPTFIQPINKVTPNSRDNSLKNAIRFENEYYGPTGQTDWVPVVPEKLPGKSNGDGQKFGSRLTQRGKANITSDQNIIFPSSGTQIHKINSVIPALEKKIEKTTLRYNTEKQIPNNTESWRSLAGSHSTKHRGGVKYKTIESNSTADDKKFQNETIRKRNNFSTEVDSPSSGVFETAATLREFLGSTEKPQFTSEISVVRVFSTTNHTTKSQNGVNSGLVIPPENAKVDNMTKEQQLKNIIPVTKLENVIHLTHFKLNKSDITNNLPKLVEVWAPKREKDGDFEKNKTVSATSGSSTYSKQSNNEVPIVDVRELTTESEATVALEDTTLLENTPMLLVTTPKSSTEVFGFEVSSQSNVRKSTVGESIKDSKSEFADTSPSTEEAVTETMTKSDLFSATEVVLSPTTLKTSSFEEMDGEDVEMSTEADTTTVKIENATSHSQRNVIKVKTSTPTSTTPTVVTKATERASSTLPGVVENKTEEAKITTPFVLLSTSKTHFMPPVDLLSEATPQPVTESVFTSKFAEQHPTSQATLSPSTENLSTISTATTVTIFPNITTASSANTTSAVVNLSTTTVKAFDHPPFSFPTKTAVINFTTTFSTNVSTITEVNIATETAAFNTSTTTTPVTKSSVTTTTTFSNTEVATDNSKEGIYYENYIPTTLNPHEEITEENVPAYLRLTVQSTSWEEMCRLKEDLRDSIIKMLGGKNVSAESVHFLNLNERNCREKIDEGRRDAENGTVFLPVNMFLMDKNGDFDKNLSEAFLTMWGRRGLDFELPIRKVDFVTPIVKLTELAEAPLGGSVVAAIVISCVAGVCVILLGILFVIMKRRQKRFNYGQRCTPVSLDAYSLDSVSIYNSVRRKGVRASKRSYGNAAFDDPEVPTHPMNFAGLANFSSDKEQLYEEFNIIPQVCPKVEELPAGAETKNRYANVIPLPETRVHLTIKDGDPLSDYINANYVRGVKGGEKMYIACQAPMESTVEDFWRMVWEQQSRVILMLTHLEEAGIEKCADYLPPNEVTDNLRLFGDFQVTLKKRDVKEKYIISSLVLKNMETNLWREVTHLWYLGWPEQGVPSEPNSLIAFLIEARSQMKIQNGATLSSPAVVHCSPGTGRTGTVIACDMCIREYEQSRMVDIPRCVFRLRRDRAGSVQTKDQYAFIYQVLNVYATKLSGGGIESI